MISNFTGEYDFLSNFHPSPVTYEGVVYPTVEHAYQAAKTEDPAERKRIAAARYPGQAKKLGRTVTMRKGWDHHKADVMLELMRQKFEDPDLREQLLATGTQKLVEGNYWHDNEWGSCGCGKCKDKKGKNLLGRLLMRLRDELAV